MERCCKICNQVKNTPYKDICRNCYQNNWLKNLTPKICKICSKTFQVAGDICHTCVCNKRNHESRKNPCQSCGRVGLILRNKFMCGKCFRIFQESNDPMKLEKRRKYMRDAGRKKRGITPLDAPIHIKKQKWKNKNGYVLTYKKGHPNARGKGCIFEHTFVMSEYLRRPLYEHESVHHKNGIRDDNRIENLELWSKSQPSGQRVEDKIKWCKEFIELYENKIYIED